MYISIKDFRLGKIPIFHISIKGFRLGKTPIFHISYVSACVLLFKLNSTKDMLSGNCMYKVCMIRKI